MNYRNLYYAFVVFVLLVTTLYEVKEIVNINKLNEFEHIMNKANEYIGYTIDDIKIVQFIIQTKKV